jgi:hypothetical protein
MAAIRAGIAVASGEIVVTFPAYPQVDASGIPRLLEAVRGGADYVVGYRERRRDSVFNRLVSRVYNGLVSGAAGIRFRDIACGVHAFRRAVIEVLPTYGDHLIVLPILADREGFQVVQVPVPQDRMERRVRMHPPTAYLRRGLDLVSLAFVVRFTQKPLRPLGALGMALFLSGGLLALVLVWQRFARNQGLAERPLLLLALLLITAGLQVIVLGLLGELLVYLHFRDQVRYRVAETLEGTDALRRDIPAAPAEGPEAASPRPAPEDGRA